MTKMWIDTDMGSDDAVALIMALRHDDTDVIGISTVAGNVPLKQASLNTRYVAELCGSDVPVYSGASKPLLRVYTDATWFHGEDGLGGYGGIPQQLPEEDDAIQALIQATHDYEGLVLVTLGPLTNIALAIAIDPTLIERVSRCVVMGGAACTYGNITPAAEYNIWVDPDAARMVFLSGMPVEMVGWEFCQHEYALDQAEIEQIREIGTPLANFVIDCNLEAIDSYFRQTGARGLSLPDPVTMAIALDRSIATEMSQHYVEIEVNSELTRGTTLVDKLNVAEDSRNRAIWGQCIDSNQQVNVTWDVDAPRWKQLLYDLIAK